MTYSNQLSLIYKFVIATLLVVSFSISLWADTAPAGDFILPDGRLNKNAIGNQQITLDIKGWHVKLDPLKGPLFYPAPQPPLGGQTWNAMDRGTEGYVAAVAVSGSDVYVGGEITNGSPVTGLKGIAKWNGTTWTALDKGLDGRVRTIAISGTNIYVGGEFERVPMGGTVVTGLNYVAKWDGTAWSALDKGLSFYVTSIAISGTNVYVGGSFTDVGTGGTPVTGLNKIAKWNGTAWSALDRGLSFSVETIAVNNSGEVYAGGEFTGGSSAMGLNNIAKWNGTAWSALDKGLNGAVLAIAINGLNVYVSGGFTDVGAGGTPVTGLNRIAKWNGTTWSALDKGLSNTAFALAVSGSDVYVGGQFDNVGTGGTPVTGLNRIAKWNGSAWFPLDKGLGASFEFVFGIATNSSNVYAGGNFGQVATGGIPVVGLKNIARWDNMSTPVASIGTSNIKIYPSITTDILTIEGSIIRLEIVNMFGQVLLTDMSIPLSSVNIHHLPKGVYLVKGIDTDAKPFAAKIIKQ